MFLDIIFWLAIIVIVVLPDKDLATILKERNERKKMTYAR